MQALFKDAPDLLEEFEDFLPESLRTRTPPPGLTGVLSADVVDLNARHTRKRETPEEAASRVRSDMQRSLPLYSTICQF